MPRFTYKALALDGSHVAGELEAGTEMEAVRALKSKRLHPLSVRQCRAGQGRVPKPRHCVQFIEDLAKLVGSGIALDKAVHLAAAHVEDARLSEAGKDMASSVHKGKSLALALEPYSDFFGPAAAPLIRAGEASGRVEDTLNNLATGWRNELEFRRAFLASLVYPAMLCVMSFVTLSVLVFYVMPNFALVFDAVGADPPWGVRLLLSLGDIAKSWWWVPLSVLLCALLTIRFGNFRHLAKIQWDGFLLRIPLISKIVLSRGLARYFTTLGRLLDGGVAVIPSLSLASRVTGNNALQQHLYPAASEVKIGRPLSSVFSKNTLFPKRVGSLLRIAEEQGTLHSGCLALGQGFEEETKILLTRLTSWIEPIVILVTGLIIGIVVIGMFTTIISVTNVDF